MKEAALRLDLLGQFDCLPDGLRPATLRLLLKSLALVGAGVSFDVSAIGTGSQIKLDAPRRYKLVHAFLLSKIYILFSNFISVFFPASINKILLANYIPIANYRSTSSST
ncbi:MAG: hypothetical protein ACMG55_11625 [Microcoleus sp.]